MGSLIWEKWAALLAVIEGYWGEMSRDFGTITEKWYREERKQIDFW